MEELKKTIGTVWFIKFSTEEEKATAHRGQVPTRSITIKSTAENPTFEKEPDFYLHHFRYSLFLFSSKTVYYHDLFLYKI